MLGLLLPLQDSYIKLKYGSVCDIFQFVLPFGPYDKNAYLLQITS